MKPRIPWMVMLLAFVLSCTGILASAQDRDRDHHDRDHHGDRDHDRDQWENRNGWDYSHWERDQHPLGWNKGRKTSWRNCEAGPGRHYTCYTYSYQGVPYYYYRDENGRLLVRRHHR